MYYRSGELYLLEGVEESLNYGRLGGWLIIGEFRDSIFELKSLVVNRPLKLFDRMRKIKLNVFIKIHCFDLHLNRMF